MNGMIQNRNVQKKHIQPLRVLEQRHHSLKMSHPLWPDHFTAPEVLRTVTQIPLSPTHDMDATDESPSHIDAESFLTVIFSLDGQERQIDAPWDDGDLLWELTAIQFEINIADVVFLYHVDHRPADIAQEGLECLLLQRQQDAPSVNFLRLCLVDVEYKADARGSQLRIDRRPKWMPRRINRASIILLAGFGGFCALSPSRCDVLDQ